MKTNALCVVEPGVTEIRSKELPDLGDLDLLVQVRVGGFCRSDVDIFRGELSVPLPFYGGHEGSGTVVATGAEVTRFQPGENVAMLGDGRFSELTICAERQAAKLPQRIDDWSTWVVEPMACCVNGVEVADVRADDLVGVVGCGFMGLAILRVLSLTPARELVGLDVRDARLDDARQSGATHVFHADDDSVLNRIEACAERRSMPDSVAIPGVQNGPLDVVFETSGTESGLRLACQLVRVGGTVVMFGHQHGQVTIDGTQWHLKGLRVLNASPMIAEDFHQVFYRTAALMSSGRLSLDGLISHVCDPAEFGNVLAASPDVNYLKGVVTFPATRDADVS